MKLTIGNLGTVDTGPYTPQALSLFSRMTTPPTTPRKVAINDLIVALIADGIWTLLDALYVFAAADSQAALLNWVAGNAAGTIGGPGFTADQGFDGNTGGYVQGITTTIGGVNNVHFGVWMNTIPNSANQAFSLNGNTLTGSLYPNVAGTGAIRLAVVSAPYTYAAQSGYIAATRSVGTDFTVRVGSANTSFTSASGGFSSGPPTNILADSVGNPYPGQMALAHYGPALTPTQLAQAETAFQAYIAAL